jgi:hypothetical protein
MATLASAVVEAKAHVDCLVLGDSIALQLAPRLAKQMKVSNRRLGLDARAGESARNFLRKHWWRDAVQRYDACPVLASLGVNCTRSERPALADTLAQLDELAGWRAVFLVLPSEGFAFDLTYLHDAVRAAGVAAIWLPRVPLETDRVHPTERSHQRIAALVLQRLWGDQHG